MKVGQEKLHILLVVHECHTYKDAQTRSELIVLAIPYFSNTSFRLFAAFLQNTSQRTMASTLTKNAPNSMSTHAKSESQITVKNPNENEEPNPKGKELSQEATPDTPKASNDTTAKAMKKKRTPRQLQCKKSRDNSGRKNEPAGSESCGASLSEDSDEVQAKAGKKDNTKQLKTKKTKPEQRTKTDGDNDSSSVSSEDDKKTKVEKKQTKTGKQNAKVIQETKGHTTTAEAKSAVDTILESAVNKSGATIRLRDVTIEQKTDVAEPAKLAEEETEQEATDGSAGEAKPGEKIEKGSKAEFARLDHVWSSSSHRFVTKPSTEDKKSGQFDGYAFNIVRYFDYSNHYIQTVLHILSKPLKIAMVHVMGKVKGISLEEETPHIDPNVTFLHLEEFRIHRKELKAKIKANKHKSKAEELRLAQKHLKVLLDYLDKDYNETKKSLFPLIESGKITFDLAWALFKSNEIVCFPTYDHEAELRAAKVEYISKVRKK